MALFRSWQARIFALTWLVYFSYYFCRKNFSIAMTWLADGGYSKDDLATVVFAYSMGYVLGQFVMGRLNDSLGPRFVVTVGMIVSAFASIASGFVEGVAALLWVQLLNGIAQACGWSGLVKIMAAWFAPSERGTAMGWWGTNFALGGSAANAFATWAATGVLFAELGWKRAFWFPPVPLLFVAAVFAIWVRSHPGDAGLAPASPEVSPAAAKVDAGWLPLVRNQNLMLIAVMYFFVKMIRYTMLFWLPLYMTEQLGLARAEAGYTSALYESIGFLGVPLAGMISDRFMGARRYPVGAMMLWGLAIACFLYPVLGAYGRWGNIIGIGLLGILTFGPDALMSGPAVQDCVPAGQTGAAAGFVNGIGSIGQQISPLLVSYVTQWFGWGVLFQIFGLMAVAAGLCLAPRWNWRPALAAAPGGLRAAQA